VTLPSFFSAGWPPRTPNMALIMATALRLRLFIGYAFVENYRIVETHV
jgi:hypothetical protein